MPSIKIENASLEFPIYDSISRSFTQSITRGIPVGGRIKTSKGDRTSILALENINLTLEDGDRVALLGHNGAGKTSFLKMLAGFYEPTSGNIEVSGKVSALLELMAGMDVNISGYDNILLCGMLHGLTKAEVYEKIEQIAEFSELGSYLNIPVRLYSQGMMLRLAFSICTSVRCDILLLDEWVGAGDEVFIKKAEKRVSEFVFQSSIMVFATHNTDVAIKLCNKAVYLEHGKILIAGKFEDVREFQLSR